MNLRLLLAAASFTLMIAACSTPKTITSMDQMVGMWQLSKIQMNDDTMMPGEDMAPTATLTFSKDGTWSMMPSNDEKQEGTYSFNGGDINMMDDSGDVQVKVIDRKTLQFMETDGDDTYMMTFVKK